MIWPFKTDTARAIGFIEDQKGIMRRYKREKLNWDSHLENTKAYISRQTAGQFFNKIAVLGSGYLLDLPTDILLSRCNEIQLYDINHPKEIQARYRDNAKISFIEMDITGLSKHLHSAKRNSDVQKIIGTQSQFSVPDADLIISLNILNQLDIILVDYLNGKMVLDMETELQLRNKIQSEHIACLTETMSLLVADTEEIHIDENGQKSSNNLFTEMHIAGITSDAETWKWSFDTTGNYAEDAIVTFNVCAVTYNKRS